MTKCPGCKMPQNLNMWGDPGPHCAGKDPEEPMSTKSAATTKSALIHAGLPEPSPSPDEETVFLAKLQELEVKQTELEKQKHVTKLKQAITEAEGRLANLVDSPASKTLDSGAPAMTAETPWKKDMKSKSLTQTSPDTLIAGYKHQQTLRPRSEHGRCAAKLSKSRWTAC